MYRRSEFPLYTTDFPSLCPTDPYCETMTRVLIPCAAAICYALALLAVTALAGNMGDLGIAPATGEAMLTKRWAVDPSLSGFAYLAMNWGVGTNQFYSNTNATIPSGGDILAFTYYASLSGTATPYNDIGSKLTPDSYSALTTAAPDLGFGSNNFYFIHHKGTTDYFAAIIPSTGVASAVTDLKPMSSPGGPLTVTGVSGYFALTFAAANLGYGANVMYYMRVEAASGRTKFGSFAPALAGLAADHYDLNIGYDYRAMAFVGDDIGYGVNKMYYLRQDNVTGYTLFGAFNPADGAVEDICSLGGLFTAVTYTPTDLGFGISKFYVTGEFDVNYQTISFAAIPSPFALSNTSGSFTVFPTASSGLPVTLVVAASSTGGATISGPVNGVFTVTPTSPGLVTLEAAQAGAVLPIAYTANSMRQSFTVIGEALPTDVPAPTTTSAVTSPPSTATPVVVTSAPSTATPVVVTSAPSTATPAVVCPAAGAGSCRHVLDRHWRVRVRDLCVQ